LCSRATPFPQVSETFIVSKFLGLLERGWDVHVVCGRSEEKHRALFPHLTEAAGAMERIHVAWPKEPRWKAVLLAPVSDTFDMLTLLSVRQHVALVLTLLLILLGWWWARGRHVPEGLTRGRRAVRQVVRIGLPLLGLFALYSAAILLPRPMAALDVGPNLVAVDFHTHTKYSHDGRWNWEPEDVRRWHRKAGFDAAYISDHRTFDGAREGWANNPTQAGTETLLLPAIEVVWQGERVNILDADRMYRGILDAALRDVDNEALRLASLVPGNEPVLIQTIPGDLSKVVAAKGRGTPGVRAIELVDGAPRGLSQSRLQRARILDIADSANIALVAGSDHHGWGHAASAWTLLVLPGWRAAPPEDVSRAIAATLRAGGRGATKVAERYVADTDDAALLPFTVPLVAWGMFRTLSLDERVVWLAWIAALVLLSRVRGMRRRRAGEP
jgi:predicted metal-dependent phosphoesterase TrpH